MGSGPMPNDVLILAERAGDRLALVSSELCGIGRKLADEKGAPSSPFSWEGPEPRIWPRD